MGIQALARTAFRSAVSTFEATGAKGRQVRRFVAVLTDAGNEWLSKYDAQESAAPRQFAESKAAQFNTFVATLPAIDLAPDPDGD